MKFSYVFIIGFVVTIGLFSCAKKKLIEVVEVPLPSSQDKITIGKPEDTNADEGVFQLIKLGYNYTAFAPKTSAVTLENHYSKHYLSYTNNLNKAIKGTDMEVLSIEELLAKHDTSVLDIHNNAGGYYNHSLYFDCIKPKGQSTPKDTLAAAIDVRFGSFGNFTSAFKAEANKHFGSGWVWLIVDKKGDLQITTTPNQDNPLMKTALVMGKPILTIDLWEHAYYLDYQYKRKNYIDDFYEYIDWKKVGENFEKAIIN